MYGTWAELDLLEQLGELKDLVTEYIQHPPGIRQCVTNPSPTTANKTNGKAIAAMVLGIISLIIPYVGILLAVAGIILAAMGMLAVKGLPLSHLNS